MLSTYKGTIDDQISIEERISAAREHKEIAVNEEIENGTDDQVEIIERGYDDLIRSLICRRQAILAV